MDRVKALGRAALDRRNLRIQAQRGQKAALYLLAAVILLGISFVILSPLISMVSQSFMTLADRYNPLVYIVPMEVTLQNFQNAYKYLQYPLSVLTTLSYSALMTALQVAVTAAAGYGFARFPFPGRRLLFGLVILTIVVPVQTIMVPLYAQFRYFDVLGLFKLLTGRPVNLLDTPLPMTLLNLTGVGLRSGLFIYIFRQYFKGVPREIEEAALIDGAGALRTYTMVMLPNAGAPAITVTMFAFVWQYNDVFYASMFGGRLSLISIKIATLSSTLSAMLRMFDANEVSLNVNAGLLLVIAPLVVVYLLLQRRFMQGVERSGIVG